MTEHKAAQPATPARAWHHEHHGPLRLIDLESADSPPVVDASTVVAISGVVSPASLGAFTEALVSWNIRAHTGAKAALEARAMHADSPWTPWLRIAVWGEGASVADSAGGPAPVFAASTGPTSVRVDVDYLRAEGPLHAIQVRVVRLDAERPDQTININDNSDHSDNSDNSDDSDHKHSAAIIVSRLDVTVSARGDRPDATDPPRLGERVELSLPFRDQKTAGDELAGRLCSPTSVAMVVGRHRPEIDTGTVAPLAHDPDHDLYGNWVRNCQTAHTLGQTAILTRLSGWAEAEAWIRGERTGFGVPVIISFSAPRGSIEGADYNTASGHLIVVHGFDEQGDPIVTDPAFSNETNARRTYPREALGRAWLGNGKGTVYLIYPEPTDQSDAALPVRSTPPSVNGPD